MSINFPSNPGIGQTYGFGDRLWTYNGEGWNLTPQELPQGLQGRQGTQGLAGEFAGQGVQGLQGLQGRQGTQGLQGAQGTQGLQGSQGAQGLQGLKGDQGAQGLQGLQGLSNQGTQGAQGLQGLKGDQGAQGLQGLQGLSNQGTQGAQGLQGLKGDQGAQGLQGLQGTLGRYTVYNQSTAPSSPSVGDYWVDNSDGTTYVYYDDGNSQQWVEFGATPQVFSGGVGVYDDFPNYVGFSSMVDFGTGLSVTPLSAGIVTVTSSATGGGSGKFDTSINNTLFVQPTGTLDIVGVGTTVTKITTLTTDYPKYILHSLHTTNVSNGDAEITAAILDVSQSVPATISVSAGSSGGPGIHTFTVGSASSIRIGMAVTGTGNIGETTGTGATAGFRYNTYVTSVDGNVITVNPPMSGYAIGTARFTPVSRIVSKLPMPVGASVELLRQPMVLDALDSIVLQSTGLTTAGVAGIGSTSTNAITQTAGSNFLTVTAGAAITNFIASGMLVLGTGTNTGIQTNTYVGVGWNPGSLSIPLTRPATTTVSNTSFSFTEVVVPADGALGVTVVYQSSTDTAYKKGTGTVVGVVTTQSEVISGITSITPTVYYGTGLTYPSIIQSIRVSNISDTSIYPGGDYKVSVGIGNSDTVLSWLAYDMVIPLNSSIELCEAPKVLGIGQSIFAAAEEPNTIEIQIAAKQKTS